MNLFESKQKPLVVRNPADIFMKYNMIPGTYVSIVYIADILQGQSSAPIKTGRMYNINTETDTKLESFINALPENNLKKLLNDFRNSSKYQSLLFGKGKTGKVDLTSEHIIKVSHLTCNWKDSKGLAKFYDKQTQAEWKLRKDYGFEDGFEDSINSNEEDSEENWRNKYNGKNILPRTKKGYNGNVYKQNTILPAFYTSLSNPDDVAIRFAYNKRSSKKEAEYYYVNDDGSLFPLDKSFIAFLTYAYKQVKEETGEDITGEEKEFVMKLKELLKDSPNTAELTMKCNQILFMKSTAYKGTNNKSESIPFVWINASEILKNYNFINPKELNKIISNLTYSLDDEDINGTIENINVKGKSISDIINNNNITTSNPKDIRQRLGLSESLNILIKLFNKNKAKTALYEKIINNLSKTVKQIINETYVKNDNLLNEIKLYIKKISRLLSTNNENNINIADYGIVADNSEQIIATVSLQDNSLELFDKDDDYIDNNISLETWKDIYAAISDIC